MAKKNATVAARRSVQREREASLRLAGPLTGFLGMRKLDELE